MLVTSDHVSVKEMRGSCQVIKVQHVSGTFMGRSLSSFTLHVLFGIVLFIFKCDIQQIFEFHRHSKVSDSHNHLKCT